MISNLQINLNPENLLNPDYFDKMLSTNDFKLINYKKLNDKLKIENSKEYRKLLSWLGCNDENDYSSNRFRIYFKFEIENEILFIGLYDLATGNVFSKIKICDKNGKSDTSYPFLNGVDTYNKFKKLFI